MHILLSLTEAVVYELCSGFLFVFCSYFFFFFFQAEDGIRDTSVTGVQTCALPISQRDSETARDRKRSQHEPSNAILEDRRVEVKQEASVYAAQSHIRQDLRLMDRHQ